MKPPEVIGDRSLCAWLVVPGACWIQTRDPKHARRLAQRGDTRLVARGVAGGFLRTFEVKRGLSWARRFIVRHASNDVATKEVFSSLKSRRSVRP